MKSRILLRNNSVSSHSLKWRKLRTHVPGLDNKKSMGTVEAEVDIDEPEKFVGELNAFLARELPVVSATLVPPPEKEPAEVASPETKPVEVKPVEEPVENTKPEEDACDDKDTEGDDEGPDEDGESTGEPSEKRGKKKRGRKK